MKKTKQLYDILHRELAPFEVEHLTITVRYLREDLYPQYIRVTRNAGIIPFTQKGKYPDGQHMDYVAYPIVFLVGDKEQEKRIRQSLRECGRQITEEDKLMDYYIDVLYRNNKGCIDARISGCPRLTWHKNGLEGLKGTKTEERIAESVHSFAETVIQKEVLLPRLLYVLNTVRDMKSI